MVEDIKSTVAKNITKLRQLRGMTQIELAEELNYSDKAVSKWERAESLPDISVLLKISEMFDVTLDYLVHPHRQADDSKLKLPDITRKKNQVFITGISILLVWLIATFVFVLISLLPVDTNKHWLTFVYSVPISMIVWLVFNSVWFNRKRNYLIVSLLMWSCLASLFLSFALFGHNIWLIFVLGIPGQIIILLWSRLKYKSNANKTSRRIVINSKE